MSELERAREAWLAAHAALEAEAPAGEPGWLQALRRDGIERFAAAGFPTGREEEWRATSPLPIARSGLVPGDGAPAPEIGRAELERRGLLGLAPVELVFVDGRFAPALSLRPALPRGARVAPLARLLAGEEEGDLELLEKLLGRLAPVGTSPFAALGNAFLRDGALVHLGRGVSLAEPVHLLFLSRPGRAALPRVLAVLEEASEARLVETHAALEEGPALAVAVGEAALGDGARLDHTTLGLASSAALHVGIQQAHAGRASRLATRSVTLGGALVRNELAVEQTGEGMECSLDGLYVAGSGQHVDNQTSIDHARPHGTSRELYKGVLDGSARAVFNGRIVVRKGAQKTDARQANRNLLLSPDAVIDTKPQLEILADDVKCSHGATIGRIDRDALFYLRARGLGPEEARSLLVYAFASEIVERLSVPAARERLYDRLFSRLPGGERLREAR